MKILLEILAAGALSMSFCASCTKDTPADIKVSSKIAWGMNSAKIKSILSQDCNLLTEEDGFLMFSDESKGIRRSFMFENDSLCALCISFRGESEQKEQALQELDTLVYMGEEDGYAMYHDSKKEFMVATARTPQWFNISKSQFIRRGTVNGYEYVDLGLTVNWARYNYGSKDDYGSGSYIAWGESTEKLSYTWSNYKYYQPNGTGYVDHECITLNKDISGTSYDVVHVKYGGNWQMPTKNQAKEMFNNCSFNLIKTDKMSYITATGKTGETIIFPCDGYYYNNDGSSGKRSSPNSSIFWTGTNESGMDAYTGRVGYYGEGSRITYDAKLSGIHIRPVVY